MYTFLIMHNLNNLTTNLWADQVLNPSDGGGGGGGDTYLNMSPNLLSLSL